MTASSWDSPPKTLVLPNNAVHVWRASLHMSAPYLRAFEDTLAADERARAERFYFQKHREHFIAGRGLLRDILSRYLDREPAQLRFCYNAYGKPSLTEETSAEGICFNLSHSHEMALYALTRGREIGVDIEYFRPDVEAEKLAERFFSPREVAVLRALPEHLRKEGFFNCWTRKEGLYQGGRARDVYSFEYVRCLTDTGGAGSAATHPKSPPRNLPLVATGVKPCPQLRSSTCGEGT